MRTMRFIAMTCLIGALATGAFAAHHENTKLMKELTAIGDMFTELMAKNDMDAMLEWYLDDAISLPNYGPRMQGMAEFKAHHEMMSGSGMKIHSFESEPTEAWESGDHVIEIGNFTISLEMPGMGKMDDKGKYMTIYVRQADGSLKIKAETWNTDLNPMMPEGGGQGEHAEHEGHGHEGHDH